MGFLTGCEDLEDTYSEHTGDGPEQYLTKIYEFEGRSAMVVGIADLEFET